MTETVTTYDPSASITYRHAGDISARARLAHRRAVDSVSTVNYRTGERAARDPFTGASVRWIDPSGTLPSVRPSR